MCSDEIINAIGAKFWSGFFNALVWPIPPGNHLQRRNLLLTESCFDDACRVTNNHRVGGNIFCNNSTRTDDRAIADFDSAHYRCSITNPDIAADLDITFLDNLIWWASMSRHKPHGIRRYPIQAVLAI